jgi:hypothetical protein
LRLSATLSTHGHHVNRCSEVFNEKAHHDCRRILSRGGRQRSRAGYVVSPTETPEGHDEDCEGHEQDHDVGW